jgi:kynureninase
MAKSSPSPYASPRSRADCEALDAQDPLRGAREKFALPEGVIYLDGHSLGPATHTALQRVQATAQHDWANGLIRSWNAAGWIDLPQTVGAKIARLIGADADNVHVTDSVSVNLFKLAAAALPLLGKPGRPPYVMYEQGEFPTDASIVNGLCDMTGALPFQIAASGALNTFKGMHGVLIRSMVNYRTGEIADVAAYEAVAAKSDTLIIWDLSHATGVIDLDLKAMGVKLAVGCTYKYLNGGPGAPAFVYVRDMPDRFMSPIWGWFGSKDQFNFDAYYEQKDGAAGFAAGTPPVLSLSALDAALDATADLDMRTVSAKAQALGDLIIARADAMGLQTISPRDGSRRGGHVSLVHENGYAIVQALIARGVIPDFRSPDAMRFGVAPLYVRFVDVWDAMDQLADVLETRAWDRPEFHARAKVT